MLVIKAKNEVPTWPLNLG